MKVNWDDDSQLNGKIKDVPNHQPDSYWGPPMAIHGPCVLDHAWELSINRHHRRRSHGPPEEAHFVLQVSGPDLASRSMQRTGPPKISG